MKEELDRNGSTPVSFRFGASSLPPISKRQFEGICYGKIFADYRHPSR